MLRTLTLLCAVAGVTAFAVPASAEVALIRPCHGTTYKYGAIVTDPVSGREYRMCIEQ